MRGKTLRRILYGKKGLFEMAEVKRMEGDLTMDYAELIKRARELCEKATPGPWAEKTNRHPQCNGDPWGWISGASGNITWSGSNGKINAAFIAASRTLVPQLCDALQDARNELCLRCGKYRDAHNVACDWCRWDGD